MRPRIVFAILLVVLTIVLYFIGLPKRQPTPVNLGPTPRSETPEPESRIEPGVPNVDTSKDAPKDSTELLSQPAPPVAPPTPAPAPEMDHVSAPPNAEVEEPLGNIDPLQDVEEVRRMVRGFRDALGENPIGTNEEITRALTGGNLKQVKMQVPRGSSINESGELVDRWGTPYFFHQISADEMEVRSAGPDRRLWTNDDHQVK